MYTEYMYKDSLAHFGIKGQRWGVRRYQNPDGSLTPEGRQRYGAKDWESDSTKAKKRDLVGSMSDKDFKKKYGHSKAKYMKSLDRQEKVISAVSSSMDRASKRLKSMDERDKASRANLNNPKMSDREYKKLYGISREKMRQRVKKENAHNELAKKEALERQKQRDAKNEVLNKEYSTKSGYNKGFIDYLTKQTGGFSQIDDEDLIDLLEMEYEEIHGKGSARKR